VQQNLVLRWVRNEALYDVWQRLSELGLGEAGAREITDVVSCPGTDSCKLGITSSMGLNQAVQDRLVQMDITDPLTRRIHVKMSGCPNGCSQHHIADIGFYGASIKVGEHTIPAYIAHIGGMYEGGEVRYGQRLKARLPAKRVPEAVQRWVRFYESEREEGELFRTFVDRVGASEFEAQVKDLTLPIEFNLENMNHFIDWNRDTPYVVARGEGECAV
jgi:sulfite reductase beta subunit-like hemoprotein